tara:strand:+ start:22225 stop:23859 length:1635 start_codon:yes stop_codon:yes gene_type:complete
MVANTLLEIYTIIFSWNIYGAIWDVLVGTGLALVPFVAAIIANFKDGYERGSVKSAIRSMEVSLISMILVLMLCVLPWTGFGMQVSTVKYDISIPDCNLASYGGPATDGDGDNTGTAYDAGFPEAGGMGVFRPVAWSLVELLSTSITHTTINSISCVNNYEYMLMRIGAITIPDVELKERVQDFYTHCYKPALRNYNANALAVPGVGAAREVMDIDWMGSRMLHGTANQFYRDPQLYMTDMERYGFIRQPAIRDTDAAREFGAHPSCHEVWLGEEGPGLVNPGVGLRDLLLGSIPNDASGDIREAWMDWGSEVITVGVADDATKEDLLIKMILQADQTNQRQVKVSISGDVDASTDMVESVMDTLFKAGSAYIAVGEFLQANAMKQILKTTGPMIISMIQFVIIIAAPFVMVLASYRLTTFTALAMTYFGFEFINAIWAFCFWFDQKLLDIFMSPEGWLDKLDAAMVTGVLSATNSLVLPLVWLTIYGYAATGMVRGMGVGGAGGGSVMGGSGAQQAGRAGQRAINKSFSSAGNAIKNKIGGKG